ncbi:MAG TPA: DUF167 domain-containing protein [Ktedonobacteraceae bacterium]|nr:DUF167 domain-containing protein [Ktedonobacteraceae bacterium]
MRISVRVIPRSNKNEIIREGNALKVYLTAPPVNGAANEALLKLLAARLDIPRRALHLVQGAAGRQKIVEIDGLTGEDIARKLMRQ